MPGQRSLKFPGSSSEIPWRLPGGLRTKPSWKNPIVFSLIGIGSGDLGDVVDIYRPSITNWGAGVRFVQGLHADSKLSIPKGSILAQQLGRMSKEALLDVNRHEFYAVQGFVNAIKFFFEPPISSLSSETHT